MVNDEWRLIFYQEDDELVEGRPLGVNPIPRFGDNIIIDNTVWEVMAVCTDYDKLYINVYIREED